MVKLKINTAALQAATNSTPPGAAPSSSSKPPKQKSSKTTASASTPSSKPPKSSKSKSSKKTSNGTSSSSMAPHAASPMPATPTGLPKIKFKSSSSALNAPSPQPQQQTPKPIRPTLKLTSSSFSHQPSHQTPTVQTPILKFKTKSKPPTTRKRRHEPGNGYDSEASDREDDPAIEEQFILRMPPGPDCDYLREVIERKELSVTSDVWLKFKDPRRAVVNVRGHLYGAVLVDLPTIIEANKTLDKKNIFKAADICQMLLVGDRIQTEDQAWDLSNRLQDVTYPHGITPPMQHVRRRRFRKRVSTRTIEAVESEVDRLLRDDENAHSSKYTLVDASELARDENAVKEEPEEEEEGYDLLGEDEYEDEDADGEVEEDYNFPTANEQPEEEMDEDALANDLDLALMGGDDEESDEDEEVQQQQPVVDEEAQERVQQRVKLQEEIADLKEAVEAKEREYMTITHSVLKARVGKVIEGFRAELELKAGMLAQLGG